ncbi:MAG: hypothetical protein A2Z34_05760 [Planctomycetes bacterium RBG_16_59_8]|nr:MAG: hypothetical protein A2Z34_05760 [Planctomycetes bacterium RBG_16_59_8]
MGKGLDIGTVNLVAAQQDDGGKTIVRKQRNAFIDIPVDPYQKNMLTRLKVPYVIQGTKMYVLGDAAFELANVLNRNTRRPMREGMLSPKESDALPVMKLLIENILGKARAEGEPCFFSVPGEPIDSTLNVVYHRDVFESVLKGFGYVPTHINEGHAVVIAELADEEFTGIGISCGGGMFNVCVSYKSMPALAFSTSRGGDWIDTNVSNVLGIKSARATLIKEKGVDVALPNNREEEAIGIYYRNLINYTITIIKERFESSEGMPTFPEPVALVCSGGTAMIGGFQKLVEEELRKINFPIPIKDVRIAKDPLNAVARGCLLMAMSEQG